MHIWPHVQYKTRTFLYVCNMSTKYERRSLHTHRSIRETARKHAAYRNSEPPPCARSHSFKLDVYCIHRECKPNTKRMESVDTVRLNRAVVHFFRQPHTVSYCFGFFHVDISFRVSYFILSCLSAIFFSTLVLIREKKINTSVYVSMCVCFYFGSIGSWFVSYLRF